VKDVEHERPSSPAIQDIMQVPFLDLKAQTRSLWSELQAAISAVSEEASFILGPHVAKFESEFAGYVRTKHCVGLNNGTSALQMALLAGGVGPGDEVITTPHTWISTSWAISYVGAKPVYVDIDRESYNLDPALLERAVTKRTKAILPVHLYGRIAKMDALVQFAERHQLLLIEDAAQAHGARDGLGVAGGIGRIGCFSFYPGKNLGAMGEAGAIVTNDDALAQQVRILRDHAQNGRHNHVTIGFNTRMEGLQGAVLSVKLKRLEAWTAARRRVAERYRELLSDVDGIQLPAHPANGTEHVWHLYVILLKQASREKVQAALAERGVATAVHYPTLVPFQPAYAELGYRPGDFPVAEEVARTCLSLPMFPELTDEQIQHVAAAVRDVVRA
jgi:dTDP-4-amino-4,6-dideoxygalactose transaminase